MSKKQKQRILHLECDVSELLSALNRVVGVVNHTFLHSGAMVAEKEDGEPFVCDQDGYPMWDCDDRKLGPIKVIKLTRYP